jgi:hypothetical protein
MTVAETIAKPGRGTYVGLFLTALSTLMLEIGLTRIFSVTMWYHFAFVAISVALFGTTAGALIVHLFPDRFRAVAVREHLWRYALVYSALVAVSFTIQLQIPFRPTLSLEGLASIVATCAVISVPFVFAGIVVCLCLTRFPSRVNRLYAADLIGASIGCVGLLVLFSWFDGPSLVILIAGIAACGAVAFASDAGNRRGLAASAIIAVLLVGFAGYNTSQSETGDAPLRIKWVKGERDGEHTLERWNAFSRITVDGDPNSPDTQFLNLVIDSVAGTAINRFDGDLTKTDHLRRLIQNLPHHIRPNADVFVIGVGGGTDILSALEFEQASVAGAEINDDIIELTSGTFGDFAGHLADQPKVNIVNDEARSHLARTDDRFDVIQISLIDTWAATGAGAFALTENALYTTEAWNLYLDRLQPDGLLTVTRYFHTATPDGEPVQPLETYRAVALASEVLTERGVAEPREHLAVYRQPTGFPGVELATLIVGRDPLSADDLTQLAARSDEFGYRAELTPSSSPDPVITALAAPGGPGDAIDLVSGDISPPTDNRPFFFQMADIDTFIEGGLTGYEHITRPVLVLVLLAATVLVLATVCIAGPLLLARRAGDTERRPRNARGFYTYFAGIGLGFLLIEVAQLQRLSSFLGHPVYGLSVVLFSVLAFSGIGSMLTERVVRDGRRATMVAPLVALLGTVVVTGAATPWVLREAAGATTPARIATAIALLAPMATMMGMPFAIGMRAAAAVPGVPVAYLWAINGATSVCASVLGVAIALFFGISTAFWCGAMAYTLALASIATVTATSRADTTALPSEDDVDSPPEVAPATT